MAVLEDKNAKRQFLRQLSNYLKGLIDFGLIKAETVNEAITDFYKKKNPEIKEFNTFYGWRKEGFTVKKGSKAFLIWGRPKEIERKKAQEANAKGEEGDKYEYYPIAYLFANTQVESTRTEPTK